MANQDEPHEIEKIIAKRNAADAEKATAAADAKREIQQQAARVKEAFAAAQKSLLAEIKRANEAIKRGGRAEEFRYEANQQPGNGNLLTANLTLNDGSRALRDYVITVDAIDGKIAVRGGGKPGRLSSEQLAELTEARGTYAQMRQKAPDSPIGQGFIVSAREAITNKINTSEGDVTHRASAARSFFSIRLM